MDWNRCVRQFIRTVEVDEEKIASLKETASSRLKYINSVPVTSDNVSFIVEGFYEVIKELLTALLLSKGLRSRNHQCLISYFYHSFPEYEAEVYLVSQMNYLRNRLNYYGNSIEFEFYEKNKDEFMVIIKIIQKLI
jgi:uncharacterized protein (UPF0332 family)